jgi:hypothetical protein
MMQNINEQSEGPPQPLRDSAHADELREQAEQAWLAKLDASIAASPARSAFGLGLQRGGQRGNQQTVAPPVVLLEGVHPALLRSDALLKCVTRTHSKSGGPGGQNRNKVQTMVLLTHGPTGVASRASERRSIGENLPVAVRRLRLNLAVLVRCPVAPGDARSPLWLARCPQTGKCAGQIKVSVQHDDFPAILAITLDMLWACQLDHKLAATRLTCTPTQLVRLWKDHPPALIWTNGHRASAGLRELL